MSNNTMIEVGERLSFYKLIKEKHCRILIPIIQRDFAQGRKSERQVRDKFIIALYQYLEENKPNRDLDFVYGTICANEESNDFIPLDGQQRLTTLFLLHWYLYQISDNFELKNNFKTTMICNGKSMFTYETRSSSSEFCKALLTNDINFINILNHENEEDCKSKKFSISEIIANESWFFRSWKFDPTIQSMLTMIDAINQKFYRKADFFERLLDYDHPIITFMFLNLKDFNLTDDLYIKMNSRGKLLSPFENFKAKFEQYLEGFSENNNFNLKFNEITKDVSLKKYFSYNIDTKWSNLFWNYKDLQNRTNKDNDVTFDDELMNFIRVIITNVYIENSTIGSNQKDSTLEYLLGTQNAKSREDYSDIISFYTYENLNVFTNHNFEEIEGITEEEHRKLINLSYIYVLYLIKVLDCFSNGNDKIKNYISTDYKFFYDENKVFEDSLKYSFDNNNQRVCFYAYISYLLVNKNDLTGIDSWMRVVHNLSHPENTIIDASSDVAAAIKSIKNLLPYSNNIIEYLISDSSNISFFSSWQVLEEHIKAHLIAINQKWKNIIEETEKNTYFNGQIGFLLEFSGILEYFNKNKNCNWSSDENDRYFADFCVYANKAITVFEGTFEDRKNNEDYIFERAVLSKGNYLTDSTQWRKNLLSASQGANIKRDHSWKRLLRIQDSQEWKDRRLCVKKVFDDSRFDITNLKDSLESICLDQTNSWRDLLISSPYIFSYCKQGYIRFENENSILLYGASRSCHFHAELYSYKLWNDNFKDNENLYIPFSKANYKYVKSIEDDASIELSGFIYKKDSYVINIYYSIADPKLNCYQIRFSTVSVIKDESEYENEIKNMLSSNSFNWYKSYKSFFYSCNNKDELLEKLDIIIEACQCLV